MRITSSDLRDLKILKNYRLIRKWICKFNDISEPDLELLIYLDSLETFTKKNYKEGVYYYSWDNRRWNRLLKNDWIKVWRFRNRTTQKYNIYKTSIKSKHLIARIYRIMLGEEEIPTSAITNKVMKRNSYSDKVMSTAILNLKKNKL
tara:strand:- start:1498 stop:1938 length:441 start_codon:yes stop_codon:yes gene_type:complete